MWSGFNSCSSSVEIIKNFLRSSGLLFMKFFVTRHATLFMIEDYNGKSLTGYTIYPYEDEVLLMPNTKLQMMSNTLSHEGGLHVVHLKGIASEQSVKRAEETRNSSNFLFFISFISFLIYLLWKWMAY